MTHAEYAGIDIGPDDKIQLIQTKPDHAQKNDSSDAQTPEDTDSTFEFYDFQRGKPLYVMAIAFVVLVALVGRVRGILSLLGVGVAVGILITFILPALLTGSAPILVAAVGSTAIMTAVLYLAHGISTRTTSALFGSLFGIAFTAITGAAAAGWAHLTGIGSEDDRMLIAGAPELDMAGVVTATIVVAGLGVLNDITVTQASAVWEMRELNPHTAKHRIFASAMRVGRDHIASSIYTLVFAYAGSMMALLLLVYTYPQNLLDLLTTEQISQEIVPTLIGAAGLILAMPVTTGFAIAFAPHPPKPSPTTNIRLMTIIALGRHPARGLL